MKIKLVLVLFLALPLCSFGQVQTFDIEPYSSEKNKIISKFDTSSIFKTADYVLFWDVSKAIFFSEKERKALAFDFIKIKHETKSM